MTPGWGCMDLMDQISLIRTLLCSRAFPDHPSRVRLVQTHLSYVFLTHNRVYKIKKAVDLGFADFSTLAKRRRLCRVEVEINRRLAPRVYLGVIPIAMEGGKPVVGGRSGAVIEYAVVMKRVPDYRLLGRRLRRGPGDYPRIARVADRLARFYRTVGLGPRDPDIGPEAIARLVRDNFLVLGKFSGSLFDAEVLSSLRAWSESSLKAQASLLRRRAREGRAVEGHGDLHLAHIYVNGEVEILDGTEFSRRFRTGDVARDLAFLAMDLDARDRHDLSRHFIRILSRRLGDPELPRLLPCYKVYRALVRAKVNALLSEETEVPRDIRKSSAGRAQRYVRLAERIARWRGGPALLVMGGLTGTGKTRIARDIVRRYGLEWVATDVLRKLTAGIDPYAAVSPGVGRGLYAPAHRRATMRAVMREATGLLRAGRPVVLDGTFQRRDDRVAVSKLAGRLGVPVHFFWCDAPPAVIRQRLGIRRGRPSISDGSWRVYLEQRKQHDPPRELRPEVVTFLDTTRTAAFLRRRVDRTLAPLAKGARRS